MNNKDEKQVVTLKRELSGPFLKVATIVAVLGVIYQFYNAGFGSQSEIQLRSMHWAFISFLAFIVYPYSQKADRNKVAVIDIILSVLALVTGLYVYMTWMEIADRMGFTIPRDIVFGVIAIVLILELTRRVVGWPLVILSMVFIAYAFLGPYMPAILSHKGTTVDALIRVLYISTEGIFGMPIGISASYVILFIIFGSFLQESGGGKLFTDLAFGLVGKSVGGPAKAAVVSSSLMGTISGAAVANVVTTGTFTIPLMKEAGYKPHVAGAIEAVSSTGGQFMPPVMGAAAFMIAEICGISYGKVALSAIIPAMLFYVYLYLCVDIEARKEGIKSLEQHELPSVKKAFVERGHLLIPLVVMVYLIVAGYSPGKSIFYSTLLVIVVSYFKKSTRMNLNSIINAIRNGVFGAIPVACACAAAGIITGVISLTGVGLRFSSILIQASGGHLFPMLVMTMIAAIILGMGLPTSAAYVILAVLTAPALIELNIPPLSAHFFIFFFGCISTITPPVALSAYAGAGIAGADPMKTGWAAFKLGLVGFIIPFLAVYRPAILLQSGPLECVLFTIIAIIAVFCLTFAVQGYFKKPLSLLNRGIFLIASFMILYDGGWILDVLGVVTAIVAFIISNSSKLIKSESKA